MDDFFDIFRLQTHPYYRDYYECVIYGEGGKRNLFTRVLLRFIQEVFGKQDNSHLFFIVIDADGAEISILFDNYCDSIRSLISSRKISRYSFELLRKHSCFDFYSPKDDRYHCLVKTIHIPISLESEILKKGLEKIRNNRSRITQELQAMPIHDAIQRLAQIMGISKEELICRSIDDDWFKDETWFIHMCKELEDFFI
jgi:hypothetical protein